MHKPYGTTHNAREQTRSHPALTIENLSSNHNVKVLVMILLHWNQTLLCRGFFVMEPQRSFGAILQLFI